MVYTTGQAHENPRSSGRRLTLRRDPRRKVPFRLPTVSKSPLRRFTDQIVLASMRPPAAPQIMINQPAIRPVELGGKRVLLTGASSGIGEAAAEQ